MAPHSRVDYKQFRWSVPANDRLATPASRGPKVSPEQAAPVVAFCLLGIEISTNVDAFIPHMKNAHPMRLRPEGPRIPVPNWLIEWSKSRDLFLTLAHDPWVFRPN